MFTIARSNPARTVAEMDNLFLIYKIYKQNKKSAVKHAAASFTADFLFCLYNFVNKIKNLRQNKRPPISPPVTAVWQ